MDNHFFRAEGAFPGTSADNRSRILVCPRYISPPKVDRCSLSDLPRRGPQLLDLGLNLGVSTPLELSEKYRFWVSHPKSSKSTVIVTVYQHSRKEMLGSDTTMGLSWRWNTVGCTVEPLDGSGWFLGSLTCHAPFSAGSDSLFPWKERREFPGELPHTDTFSVPARCLRRPHAVRGWN